MIAPRAHLPPRLRPSVHPSSNSRPVLTHLHISNYALIDSLDLDLGADFTVITGETGAGKSIILGALGLLQGHRADAKVLRRADAKCIVEGTFDTAGLPIEPLLEAAEIEADGHTLLIRREISAAGKSRAFVNDTPATLNVLRQLAEHLIDIHSQHQNLLLSHENYLLDTLDLVADNAALRHDYAQALSDHRAARRRLQELQELSGRDGQDRDYLSFQLEQIDGSAFEVDEQARLEADSEALTHAEDIQSALAHAATRLSNDEFDVLDCLRQAESDLRDAARHRPETEALADRLESARIEIDDILSDVERLADSVEIDPVGLERTNRRLSKLYALQRKHNVETIAELHRVADDFRARLDAIDHAEEHLAEAQAQLSATLERTLSAGAQLTDSRRRAGEEICTTLRTDLAQLGMPHTQLAFDFRPRTAPDATGTDTVTFLFSANPGMPPRDLAETASGGEIARLMLALKALVAGRRNLPSIVFDEIDTGVSGTMARRMGQLMRRMGHSVQVLCITHLPQIAALGTDHLRVAKHQRGGETLSTLTRLTADERINELATMLSGTEITPAALANARELLDPTAQ